MSPKYELVKRYYQLKMWNLVKVKAAVVKGWITDEEFTEITGEPYEEE